MARTVVEMLTSGDVRIGNPGPNWGFILVKGQLSDEDFTVLMNYVLTNHPSHQEQPQ